MTKNIKFNLTFKNVPNSMLTAMAKMEIGDVTEPVEIDFKREENLHLFAELCSVYKVHSIKERIEEMVLNELEINKFY